MAWTQKVANAPTKEEIDHLNQSIEHLDFNDAKCVKIEYEDGTEEIINDAAIVIWWSIKDDIGIETANGSHQKFQDMIARFREKTYVPLSEDLKEKNDEHRGSNKTVLGVISAIPIVGLFVAIFFRRHNVRKK